MPHPSSHTSKSVVSGVLARDTEIDVTPNSYRVRLVDVLRQKLLVGGGLVVVCKADSPAPGDAIFCHPDISQVSDASFAPCKRAAFRYYFSPSKRYRITKVDAV